MKHIVVLLTIIALIGCKVQKVAAPAPTIVGTQWKLIKMGDVNLSALTKPVTLQLDETRKGIGGHGGCNGYFGGYQMSGENISFTGIGSTKMFCQDTQTIEDAYFKALGTVQSYKTEENKLYLLAQDKVVLEFSK